MLKNNAEYKIEHKNEDGFFEITLSGQCNTSNASALTKDVFEIANKANDTHLLFDISKLNGRLQPDQIYFHIGGYPMNLISRKIAIVDIPQNDDINSFYALAAGNIGFNIRYFHERDAAIDWLYGNGFEVANHRVLSIIGKKLSDMLKLPLMQAFLWSCSLSAISAGLTIIIIGYYTDFYLLRDHGIFILFLLFPQALLFQFLQKKSMTKPIIAHIFAAIIIVGILMGLAYHKEKILIGTEHFYLTQTHEGALTGEEMKNYRSLIDRQFEFLSACRMVSAEVYGSFLLLASCLLINLSPRKILTAILIVPGLGLLILLCFYAPFPIEGRWGGITGCMTSSYNYGIFSDGKVNHYNICASVGNQGSKGPYGKYKRLSLGTYEWSIDIGGSSEKKSLEITLKTSFMLMRMQKEETGEFSTIGYRNIDFYTQYRFRKYFEKFAEMYEQHRQKKKSAKL